MSLDNQFKIKKIANSSILYDDSVIAEPTLQLFAGQSFSGELPDGDYHTNSGTRQNNSAAGSSTDSKAGIGRAQVVYFQHDNNFLVLKHYYRGGMVAHLSKDCYLGFDVENSRAFKEFRLLKKMVALGLPVPDAVAARVEKQLFTYRADLITREIENVKTLADLLSEQELASTLWRKTGSVIKQFHKCDIYHADLNARNILITGADDMGSEDIYLIDFDNSYIRTDSESWKRANLARLNRSLMKFKNNDASFNFNERSWSLLLEGYAQ